MIGKLAAQKLVNNGDIIYLEAGSTCYEIIPYLADHKDLTIVVNSLYLMTRLGEMVQHKVILIGGEYRADRMDLRGAAASAYGALNLPSRRVKDLILDQAKN